MSCPSCSTPRSWPSLSTSPRARSSNRLDAGRAHECFASLQHVVERPEGHHVVARVAAALDPGEHPLEVDRALARAQVLLVSAVAVGHPHLAAVPDVPRALARAPDVHRVEEAVDPFGDEMRVVHRECPAEARRLDAAEVLAALL